MFMDKGSGKTKVALDLMASRKHKVDYFLWICPNSIISTGDFEEEHQKWHPELDIDVISYEAISMSDRRYLETYNKVVSHSTFIVADESLFIKNSEAIRTQRILKLGMESEYRLILNGTPIAKNVLNLWPQMQFLSPKILNMTYNEFKNTYCEYYIRGRLKGMVKKQYNIPHLISLIRPYIFDCELDLNVSKRFYKYEYSMEADELEEYEEIKQQFLQDYVKYDNLSFLALAQKLQACYCGCRGKQALLNETIRQIDDKVIVYVKYLKSIPPGSLSIHGGMNRQERTAVKKAFKASEKGVLYITYGCGSHGLNLQLCKHTIFADHTFDYEKRDQAEGRTYRMGQDYDTSYYDLNCNIGLERFIQGSCDKKIRLLDEIKKEIEKKGVEEWVKSI